MKFEIKNRWTRAVQTTVEIKCMENDSYAVKIGLAVKWCLSRGANLRDAYLCGANLRGADLCGADLSDADLRGADLCDANLRDANLRGADLCGANLRGANLRDAYLCGANLRGANLCGAYLCDANLRGAYLCDANLRGADLCDANLRGADLCGAYLCDANLRGKKISEMRVFTGLYRYQVWAVLFQNGTRWVRMGCLFKSLEEWDKIGIRKSNEKEFPDDGSDKCEERVRAFEFAKEAALMMRRRNKHSSYTITTHRSNMSDSRVNVNFGFIHTILGVITAVIGYEIHHSIFWAVVDWLFWPLAWFKWLLCQEVYMTTIKGAFSFFLK